jgi:hypothetical protein
VRNRVHGSRLPAFGARAVPRMGRFFDSGRTSAPPAHGPASAAPSATARPLRRRTRSRRPRPQSSQPARRCSPAARRCAAGGSR